MHSTPTRYKIGGEMAGYPQGGEMATQAITGSAFALARWFQEAHEASGHEDDDARDQVLNEVYRATAVAVSGTTTLVHTPNGACLIEARNPARDLITFDYVENDRWTRTSFWMNASSVRGLGDHLRTVPRRSFDELFINLTVKS